MNVHKNARLTPLGREELVRRWESGSAPQAISRDMGVSVTTVYKWLRRYRHEGVNGLVDRSSRPRRLRAPTPEPVRKRILSLRRARLSGIRIARELGVSPATVSRVLRRARLSRARDLEPKEPVRRYQRERPGELLHIDIKKLGRFQKAGHRVTGSRSERSNGRRKDRRPGWECVHVCVDDASRIAFTGLFPDETAASATAFLRDAVAYYESLGVTVERVMTDNGSCYTSRAFAAACAAMGLRHIRTRPYSPKTNGKAERFIQTALREWAYARPYDTSDHRAALLPRWTHDYNWHRPHSAIKSNTPISTLGIEPNNLLRLHT